MSAAAEAFKQMRRIIDAPARDAVLWAHMTRDQRTAVLIGAGLPQQWHSRQWERMTSRERQKILDQITAFANWARRLQVPR